MQRAVAIDVDEQLTKFNLIESDSEYVFISDACYISWLI